VVADYSLRAAASGHVFHWCLHVKTGCDMCEVTEDNRACSLEQDGVVEGWVGHLLVYFPGTPGPTEVLLFE
jgi:hypothetical protein